MYRRQGQRTSLPQYESVREDSDYPRLYLLQSDHNDLVLSRNHYHNPIPILPNSKCHFPDVAIDRSLYYKHNPSKFMLMRSLWLSPPEIENNTDSKVGFQVRFPDNIPPDVLHAVVDGSFNKKRKRGGYGGAVSDSTATIWFTLEGRAKRYRNSLYHEIQAVKKLVKECIRRGLFWLWVYSDCTNCIRFLKDNYVFTKKEIKRFGQDTCDLAVATRDMIRNNFTNHPDRVLELKFSYREGTYVADHCSKAFRGSRSGKRIREGFRYSAVDGTVLTDENGDYVRSNELSVTSRYFEKRYKRGLGGGLGLCRYVQKRKDDLGF